MGSHVQTPQPLLSQPGDPLYASCAEFDISELLSLATSSGVCMLLAWCITMLCV
jgi:hypothetical protein